MVLPDLQIELKSILLAEAKENVLMACARKLRDWIKLGPYTISFPKTSKDVRIMGIAFDDNPSQAVFCAMINMDGEVTDYLQLLNFTSTDENMKPDTAVLMDFLRDKRPHVIAVAGESTKALEVQRNLQQTVKMLVDEDQFSTISVEITNNDLAKVYADSKKGLLDFPKYPTILRQAISVARRLQDPLVEFAQLWTDDKDILRLLYHPQQDLISKDDLLNALNLQFVNQVNEVGLDINSAIQNSRIANLVPFICGLGLRKSEELLKVLKKANARLENRSQLMTNCHMGPNVFINCSGFIKIDTNSLSDSLNIEILDSTRVHPESYDLVYKLAFNALKSDPSQIENPSSVVKEIIESPKQLKRFYLDQFAIEQEQQRFDNKSLTLYDIRNELSSPYKDLRREYKTMSRQELFEVLTKGTIHVNKLVLAKVKGITYFDDEQHDNFEPIKNSETGLWQCPFCWQNDFTELDDIRAHIINVCFNQTKQYRISINGLTGYIRSENLSDENDKWLENRIKIANTIYCYITKIDVENFTVECSPKLLNSLDQKSKRRKIKNQHICLRCSVMINSSFNLIENAAFENQLCLKCHLKQFKGSMKTAYGYECSTFYEDVDPCYHISLYSRDENCNVSDQHSLSEKELSHHHIEKAQHANNTSAHITQASMKEHESECSCFVCVPINSTKVSCPY